MERSDSITLGTLAHFSHLKLVQFAGKQLLSGVPKAWPSGPGYLLLPQKACQRAGSGGRFLRGADPRQKGFTTGLHPFFESLRH